MDFLKGISQTLQSAEKENSPDSFTLASTELVKMKNRLRERFQELTAAPIREVIGKLENFQPLSAAEKDYVRTWMVGDADSYTRMENNFKDWTVEFGRLIGVLRGYEAKEETVPNLLNAHGVVTDAMRVAADISLYLEEKARVERFAKAMENLSQSDAELVARLLRAKLESSEM